MAGITELPFRRMAKEAGCALVVTEMLSSEGLIRGAKKTAELLKSHPSERPLCAQIFGANPDSMAGAAQMVEGQDADTLDINLGCSVRKIVRQGAGVALMREPERLKKILKAVCKAVSIPVTIKIRSGWNPSGDQALSIARMAQDIGIDAITIHPRTALQGFSGKADWSLIARLKEALSIPVVGNGDVRTPEDALRMQQETGCDAVMIGRAAIGNPWIFAQTLDLLHSKEPRSLDMSTRLQGMLRYIDYAVGHFGEARAVRMLRGRLCWFVKGLPVCSSFRCAIARLKSRQEMRDAVVAYFGQLQTSAANGLSP
jgi:nifR3 family TIM-barrel protein